MKTIHIYCKPRSRLTKVIPVQTIDGQVVYHVYLTASPVDGQANQQCVSILSDYFSLASSRIHIIRGIHSRHKTIALDIQDTL